MTEAYVVTEVDRSAAQPSAPVREINSDFAAMAIDLKQATGRATAANIAFSVARRSALEALQRTEHLLQEVAVRKQAKID